MMTARGGCTCAMAADEIERLLADRDAKTKIWAKYTDSLEEEIERMRAALDHISKMEPHDNPIAIRAQMSAVAKIAHWGLNGDEQTGRE